MKNMTPNRMAQACGGTYIGRTEDADREITSITADSRKAERSRRSKASVWMAMILFRVYLKKER